MKPGRTGSGGRPWVQVERPKPPPVEDRYLYWSDPPHAVSLRCLYWARQIDRGWLPNRRIGSYGYDTSAGWYGVYIWEYLNILFPLIQSKEQGAQAA